MTTRLVFAGTPAFALPSLRALVAGKRAPLAVLTQPDRPAGRGRKVSASPVKAFAIDAGIPVLQPQTLRDPAVAEAIREFAPAAMIVAAYGLLFPQNILELPPLGCINVHASLLPRWRGAAPVQAAILAGDPETGISLMKMERGLDVGAVYRQRSLQIGRDETAGELTARLAELGAALLSESLDDILAGGLPPVAQDDRRATHAPKLGQADARLDWRLPVDQLWRRVRAANPAPGSWFEYAGERMKCWSAEPMEAKTAPPGTVLAASPAGIDVACGDGALRMTALQRPGRGRISAREFADQLSLADARLPI